MPHVRDLRAGDSRSADGRMRASDIFAASDSCAGRFFALPFNAIAGFAEVAETARSLATLPVGLDLDHFARPGEDSDIGRKRSRLRAPPDMERMAFFERRYAAASKLERLVRRIEATRGKAGQANAGEAKHEWRIGPTNFYFRNPSPRIAPLRRSVDRFFGGECPCVGDQFYPPGSFRGWHTDRFGYTGWVVFLVEVAEPGKSSFRYVDPRSGKMVVVPDRNDVAYFFRPSAEEPLFWHGVLCEDTFRWSQGFSLPQDWRSRIRLVPPEGA